MKKNKYLIVLLCFVLCFTSCSNLSENKEDSSDPLPNATFESIDEIKNLIAAAKESEDAFQKYREELPYSGSKLNIFYERDDVFEFENYVNCTEFPVVIAEAKGSLDRMKIDYSNWRKRIFDCVYYIDGLQYRFIYYNDIADIKYPEGEVEVQLDEITFKMYKNKESNKYIGHMTIGKYEVEILVDTLDIDAITFEHFNLEKILE